MNKKIRVLQLIYSFGVEGPGGGIGRFVMDLSKALDRDQFETSIFAMRRYGTPLEQEHITRLQQQGIHAFTVPNWNEDHPYTSFWRASGFLRTYLTQQPVSVIHSHSEFTDILGILARISPQPPRVMRSVHYGFQFEWRKRPLRRLLFTNLLIPMLFEQEIGVSQAITEGLNARLLSKILHKPALYLPNAIDLDRFRNVDADRQGIRQALGVPPSGTLILSVGRLTEQKGYPYLVEAARRVLENQPQTYFVIVGEGEMLADLEAQAGRLTHPSHLRFTGPRADIEQLLSAADLFVSSSLWEGLPTVILESMAAGLPVVATDIPGTRDLVRSGESGWLAAPADAYSLSEAILKACQERKKWPEIVSRAQQTVGAYNISRVAETHQAIYQELAPSQRSNR